MALFRRILESLKKKFRLLPSRRRLKRRSPAKKTKKRSARPPKSSLKRVLKSSKSKKRIRRPVGPKKVKTFKAKVRFTKKKPSKKLLKGRSLKPKEKSLAQTEGFYVGEITHFFSKIKVCVVRIDNGSIIVGDKLRIEGGSGHFIQKVISLQIENKDVKIANKGQLVGLKVNKKTRPGSKAYKIS